MEGVRGASETDGFMNERRTTKIDLTSGINIEVRRATERDGTLLRANSSRLPCLGSRRILVANVDLHPPHPNPSPPPPYSYPPVRFPRDGPDFGDALL